MKCPQCESDAKGKFCHNCGTALGGATCAQCGADLAPGARFCHACAAPVGGGGASSGTPSWLPWGIAGAVAIVLIGVAIMLQDAGAPQTAGTPQATAPASGVTDISQMSPRERANRLFDRVMRAAETGDTANVQFFSPMAIQAHEMMGAMDTDARFHLGQIHLVAGNAAGARAQGDSILADVPTHLYGFLLRAEAARLEEDSQAARRADQSYLEHFAAEAAANRQEYLEHPGLIEAHRTTVQNRN